MSSGERPRRENGFTLLTVMTIIALILAALLATLFAWSQARAAQKAEELLWVGGKFRDAIGHYYEQGSARERQYPQRLEDLLEDPRSPELRRHLRKIYRDPVTGRADWVIIPAPDGGIMGVHSRSQAQPVRTPATAGAFLGAKHYSDWTFVYAPPAPSR